MQQAPPTAYGSEARPMREAFIVMVSAIVAMLAGVLTFAQTGSWPAALLAGLTRVGAGVPAMHQLVDR